MILRSRNKYINAIKRTLKAGDTANLTPECLELSPKEMTGLIREWAATMWGNTDDYKNININDFVITRNGRCQVATPADDLTQDITSDPERIIQQVLSQQLQLTFTRYDNSCVRLTVKEEYVPQTDKFRRQPTKVR